MNKFYLIAYSIMLPLFVFFSINDFLIDYYFGGTWAVFMALLCLFKIVETYRQLK